MPDVQLQPEKPRPAPTDKPAGQADPAEAVNRCLAQQQGHRLRRLWCRLSRSPHPGWRITRVVVGVVMILAGVVMWFIPGPGTAFVIGGVVLIAPNSRFSRWIKRKLRWARKKLADFYHRHRGDKDES